MNNDIKHMVINQTPKIRQIDPEEARAYKMGLRLFATFVQGDFLDIPLLPDDTFTTDGLFYRIPYLHEDNLYRNGRSYMLLVAYQVDEGELSSPLRIDFEVTDYEAQDFTIQLIDQSGGHTVSHCLIEKKDGLYYTDDSSYMYQSLSKLIARFASSSSIERP